MVAEHKERESDLSLFLSLSYFCRLHSSVLIPPLSPSPQHEPGSVRERLVAKLTDAIRTFVAQEKLAQAHFLVV